VTEARKHGQSDLPSAFHDAFLARAANAGDEHIKTCAMAAFLTLRLVDQLAKAGPSAPGAASRKYQVKSTSDFVSQICPRTTEVNHLAELVRVASGATQAGFVRVLYPPMLAFAYWLEEQLRLDEALDVLDTALRMSDGRVADEEIATQLQRARALRRAGRLEEAGEGYAKAGALAIAIADHRSELLSRIGRAIVLQKTGNLPESERVLREVLEDARALGDRDTEARACHDLAVALARRERHAEGVPLAFRAYELYEHPAHRARALSDTGTLLKELGHYSAAKDALTLVVGSRPPTDLLLLAKLELLDVGAQIGDRISFERWRKELAADRDLMPPDVQVDFAMKLGAGLAAFDRSTDALAELDRAIALAERHGLGESVFRAERLLNEVREHRSRQHDAAAPPSPLAPSPELQRAIDSLRRLRESQGTAAVS
jgi:tetratricopeptide (TPR) repeat protein